MEGVRFASGITLTRHRCAGSRAARVSVRHASGYAYDRDNGWHLIRWARDWRDCDGGWIGDDVGRISYCPYCGVRLEESVGGDDGADR